MRQQDRPNVVETLEARRLLSGDTIAGIATDGGDFAGNLSGRTVFVNAGHGLKVSGNNWSTDRGDNNEIVEDFGNQDQLRFFADYLLRAGAAVVPFRPIGHQPNEVIVDNDDAGVTYDGGWLDSQATSNFFGTAGDVPYRFASTTASSTPSATFNADLPEPGAYPVYTWVLNSTNRGVHTYTINHSGGDATVEIDHAKVGAGWVYLGTYNFDGPDGADASVNVRTDDVGKVVIADAIRFGNGLGDIDRGTGISGATREDEGALYWIEAGLGVGVSINQFRGGSSSDGGANINVTPRYAAFMNSAPYGDSVLIGFHTNAGGGRGVLSLFNTGDGTPNQLALAQRTAQKVNDELSARTDFEFPWNDRGSNVTFSASFNYGEIRGSAVNNEMDATIVEVGFHDDLTDARLLRDANVRDAAARATYRGVVDHLVATGGVTAGYIPDAPNNVRALNVDGGVQFGWEPQSGVTSYEIQASLDGKGFDTFATSNFSFYTASAAELAALSDGPIDFRVIAKNAAGSSIPSRVVTAKVGSGPSVLLVNGFNRLDRFQNIRQTASLNYNPPASGQVETFDRVRPMLANTFDYVTVAADALPANVDWQIDSAQSENIEFGTANLQDYDAVVWLAGEESTNDLSLSFIERSLIAAYIDSGGNIFLSGAEVAWDLATRSGVSNNGAAFLADFFGVEYRGDDANAYGVSFSEGIFAGVPLFEFDDGSEIYDVDFPDLVLPIDDAQGVMTYFTPSIGQFAAVTYEQPASDGSSVFFGFPFETILDETIRADLMQRIVGFFGLLDTAAPTLTASARNVVDSVDLVFAFDKPVTAETGNLIVAGPDGSVPATDFVINGGGTDTLTFTYAPGGEVAPLANGNYTATLTGVTDLAGNLADPALLPFYFLNGDTNGDRDVDLFDALELQRNFGRASDVSFSDGDLDFDDDVDLFDALILVRNFGTVVTPPPPLQGLTSLFNPNRGDGLFGQTRLRELR
ncbi:MAG: hypothetical protein AAGD32_15405 [Planctomycetota bacterium]